MPVDPQAEFAGECDVFLEVFGVEVLDEGVGTEGLGAGEKGGDPAVFDPQAELQDRCGGRPFRVRLPLFAEGGLPCFGTGLSLLCGLGCPQIFLVQLPGSGW